VSRREDSRTWLGGIVVGRQTVRQLPHPSEGAEGALRTKRGWGVSTVADLLFLVLRVLPEEIRKWLNAERNLPRKRKERVGTSDSAHEDRGSR
jgi:hypothetical protein